GGAGERELQISATMSGHRPVLGQAVATAVQTGDVSVRRHAAVRQPTGGSFPEPTVVGIGLAASAIFQADAERRGPARPDAGLGPERTDSKHDLRSQSDGVLRIPSPVSDGSAQSMIPKKPAPDLIRGWVPVFGKDHAPAKS